MIFGAEDFIAKLAALVPKPRAHLTRYHGVLAPASRLRAEVVPSGRGRRRARPGMAKPEARERTDLERHRAARFLARKGRFRRLNRSQNRCPIDAPSIPAALPTTFRYASSDSPPLDRHKQGV